MLPLQSTTLIPYTSGCCADLKITGGHRPILKQFAKLASQGYVCSDKASDHYNVCDKSNAHTEHTKLIIVRG